MRFLLRLMCAVLVFTVTGCQGRLRLVISNDTQDSLSLLSDGRIYIIPAEGQLTINSPEHRTLFVQTGQHTYRFSIPFGPRPHSLNTYVDEHLSANLRIRSASELVIVSKDKSQGRADMSVIGEKTGK